MGRVSGATLRLNSKWGRPFSRHTEPRFPILVSPSSIERWSSLAHLSAMCHATWPWHLQKIFANIHCWYPPLSPVFYTCTQRFFTPLNANHRHNNNNNNNDRKGGGGVGRGGGVGGGGGGERGRREIRKRWRRRMKRGEGGYLPQYRITVRRSVN